MDGETDNDENHHSGKQEEEDMQLTKGVGSE